MELAIVKYIKEFGLDAAVSEFKLIVKDYPNKILLKYNQLDSPFNREEVRESRGLILRKNTWEVISYPFYKFFNNGEPNAAKIDWNTARVLSKKDGSLISLYFDDDQNKWHSATTGTSEGESEVNNKPGTSFAKLFIETSLKYNFNYNTLDKDNIYMFEICTPFNVVVTPHTESKLVLLAVRHRPTLKEYSYDELKDISIKINIPLVESYELNNINDVLNTLVDMPYQEEGYVVVDKDFNRIKIKNPAYVACHFLKSKTAYYHIMEIIKSNEIDEYISTFPEREDEINQLRFNYEALIIGLDMIWNYLKDNHLPKDNTPEEKKRFALYLIDLLDKQPNIKRFQGMYFSLANGSLSSIRDYIKDYDNRELYHILNK